MKAFLNIPLRFQHSFGVKLTRRILAGNPFYPLSAALLLFGINRLSLDPNLLEAGEAKLAFNFSALQLYEVLLVVVAIIVARRRIWYDSTLLIGLENMLVPVPFILVTQAFLNGNGVGLAVCLAGTFMAIIRFASLRKFFPELICRLVFWAAGLSF